MTLSSRGHRRDQLQHWHLLLTTILQEWVKEDTHTMLQSPGGVGGVQGATYQLRLGPRGNHTSVQMLDMHRSAGEEKAAGRTCKTERKANEFPRRIDTLPQAFPLAGEPALQKQMNKSCNLIFSKSTAPSLESIVKCAATQRSRPGGRGRVGSQLLQVLHSRS